MRLSPALAVLPALLVLTACASPRDRCVAQATADLRVIEALIAETETNIARGYATVSEPAVRTGLQLCVSPDDAFIFCTREETTVRQRAVAIDAAAERRKLSDLRARRAALQAPTRAALATCNARHPAG